MGDRISKPVIPARCCSCGSRSGERPAGEAPARWSIVQHDDGMKQYMCSSCARACRKSGLACRVENAASAGPSRTGADGRAREAGMSGEDSDPFRYCVYCGADCYEGESEHADDCPSATGVFPVREKDLDPCENCGHYRHGMACMDCGAEFKPGDFYVHREVESGDPLLPGIEGAAIREVICIGCAAGQLAREED